MLFTGKGNDWILRACAKRRLVRIWGIFNSHSLSPGKTRRNVYETLLDVVYRTVTTEGITKSTNHIPNIKQFLTFSIALTVGTHCVFIGHVGVPHYGHLNHDCVYIPQLGQKEKLSNIFIVLTVCFI